MAVDIFEQWISARLSSGCKVPPDDLFCRSKLFVSGCRFFTEVCQADGNPYCQRSLSSILAELQRHMQSVLSHSLKIQDTEGDFKPLNTLQESMYQKLHEKGYDAVKSQVRGITLEEGGSYGVLELLCRTLQLE